MSSSTKPTPSSFAGLPASNLAYPRVHSQLFAPATNTQPPRVCVIAEIGVNHDGNVTKALELVRSAVRAGADAVKFQLFDPRHLLSNQSRLAVYQESSATDVFTMLDRLKLSLRDMLTVRAAARNAGIAFIVTPFSLEDFDALRQLDVDAVKIASPDAVNNPLLELTASLGRPMIVSTGTAELDELEFVAELVRDRPSCLMQCISSYPTPTNDAGLGGISVLSHRFGLPTGYSDHTTNVVTGALAVAAGACVIEKHLTYDPTASGPDHAASFDGESFYEYVSLIRQAAMMHGPANKAPHAVEADVRSASRQSLCIKHDLPAGHVLTRNDLTIKRPGTGIPAAHFNRVLGRKLIRAVKANDLLTADDI
ncbi:MAG: N-acetylneuraminate synthase family protein [Phycisphaeraceae bacterium]|nr:N-acetylneuraminate synthase family protein [Phycisphaeraceae bacterium]